MKRYYTLYKEYFSNKRFVASVVLSFLLLFVGLIINYYAGTYATLSASNHVSDIILDNIPVFHLENSFMYGPVVLWFFVIILCLRDPKKIPFVLKSIALFILVRSIFITLTHIGPFPDRMVITDPSVFMRDFTFGGDLFFSGHTGIPFLLALVFSRNKKLRILFFLTSLFFGVVVLLAHVHYTIDVLSAFFITYTIYKISCFLFKEDERLFVDGLKNPSLPDKKA